MMKMHVRGERGGGRGTGRRLGVSPTRTPRPALRAGLALTGFVLVALGAQAQSAPGRGSAAAAAGAAEEVDPALSPAQLTNPYAITAQLSAAQRSARRTMNRYEAQGGSSPTQRYEITLDERTLRELRATGLPVNLNICSLVAEGSARNPGRINGSHSRMVCSVNGVGN